MTRALLLGTCLLALATAGCSDGGDEAVDAPTTSTASAAPEVTMQDACPMVEAALPKGMIPKGPAMTSLVAELDELSATGDTETANAVELLYGPARDLESAVTIDASGSDLLDPLDAYIDGISAFAKRCKAAGSSALQ